MPLVTAHSLTCLEIDLTKSAIHAMCFGNMTKTTENRNKNITNYNQILGYEVLEWIDGHALLASPIQKKHRNRGRSIHGGVIASLVNVAGKMAGNWTSNGERKTKTINLNINFISGTSADLVHVKGVRAHATEGTLFSNVKIFLPDTGIVIASGQGVFKLLRSEATPTRTTQ